MRTSGSNHMPLGTHSSAPSSDKAQVLQRTAPPSPSRNSSPAEQRETSPTQRGRRPKPAKPRPFLLLFAAMYCLLHSCFLYQMLSLWRASTSTPSQASSWASSGYLVLSLFELFALSFAAYCTHGLLALRFSDEHISDGVLVILSGILPMLQVLMALFHPPFLTMDKNWAAISAVLMSAAVTVGGLPPAHSLLQLLVSSTCFTFLHCYGHEQRQQQCPDSSWGFVVCFLTQELVIGGAGAAAWVTTYVLAMKASALSTRIRSQAETMTTSSQGPQGVQGAGGAESASAGGQQQQADGSGSMREENPGSDSVLATSPRTPLPFESWGMHWPPAAAGVMQRLEQALNAFAAVVNEQTLVWVVCLPVMAYSLLFCILVRMKFQGASYCDMSPDAFMLYMMTWFMVGRSSSALDLVPVMLQLQTSLSASFARAAHQPSLTLTELVDRARHLVTGGAAAQQASASQPGHQITVTELLGEGTFGKVYKGVWRGTLVAVKRMTLPGDLVKSERRERMAIMEAAISSALVHPNLVQTYSYSVKPADHGSSCTREIHVGDTIDDMTAAPGDGSTRDLKRSSSSAAARGLEVQLVLEYMDCGTLRDVLDQGCFETAPPSQHMHGPSVHTVNYCAVLETAADVAKGMVHLHSLNVIHCDLKARNVLLRSCASDPRSFIAKVGDFGLSLKLDSSGGCVDSLFYGTVTHMAPEVLLHGRQSKAADVYAFGITMWELYTGQRPFQGVNRTLLRYHIAEQGHRPDFPPQAPDAFADLAARCWDTDPEARPSFEEVVDCLSELLAAESGERVAVPVTVLGAQATTFGPSSLSAPRIQPVTSVAAAMHNAASPPPSAASTPRCIYYNPGSDGGSPARMLHCSRQPGWQLLQPNTLQEQAAAGGSSDWDGEGLSAILVGTTASEADCRPSLAGLVSMLPTSFPVVGGRSSNETQPTSTNWRNGLGFISERGQNPGAKVPVDGIKYTNPDPPSELPSGIMLGGDDSTLLSQL